MTTVDKTPTLSGLQRDQLNRSLRNARSQLGQTFNSLFYEYIHDKKYEAALDLAIKFKEEERAKEAAGFIFTSHSSGFRYYGIPSLIDIKKIENYISAETLRNAVKVNYKKLLYGLAKAFYEEKLKNYIYNQRIEELKSNYGLTENEMREVQRELYIETYIEEKPIANFIKSKFNFSKDEIEKLNVNALVKRIKDPSLSIYSLDSIPKEHLNDNEIKHAILNFYEALLLNGNIADASRLEGIINFTEEEKYSRQVSAFENLMKTRDYETALYIAKWYLEGDDILRAATQVFKIIIESDNKNPVEFAEQYNLGRRARRLAEKRNYELSLIKPNPDRFGNNAYLIQTLDQKAKEKGLTEGDLIEVKVSVIQKIVDQDQQRAMLIAESLIKNGLDEKQIEPLRTLASLSVSMQMLRKIKADYD